MNHPTQLLYQLDTKVLLRIPLRPGKSFVLWMFLLKSGKHDERVEDRQVHYVQKDLLPVLEALVEDLVVLDHLIRLIDTPHVSVVIRNCLRSGDSHLPVTLFR